MTERTDGVLFLNADTGAELAHKINQTKKTHAIFATQTHAPTDTVAKWGAFCFYASKFPNPPLLQDPTEEVPGGSE